MQKAAFTQFPLFIRQLLSAENVCGVQPRMEAVFPDELAVEAFYKTLCMARAEQSTRRPNSPIAASIKGATKTFNHTFLGLARF
jgi:hypothetical protein